MAKFIVGDKVQTTEQWNNVYSNDSGLRGVPLQVTGYSQGFVCVSGSENIKRFHEDNLELVTIETTDTGPIGAEACDRCHEVGYDRRTLWHACMYEMKELGPPFIEYAVRGVGRVVKQDSDVSIFLKETIELPQGKDAYIYHRFYTLRVCKDCRGDWLRAIGAWFGRGENVK